MNKYLNEISKIAREISDEVVIMEVCGGHTNTIMKYGIRNILPSNVKLISGPGCPVCVTSQEDIDSMIVLAKAGIKIATYGDMMHVPGTTTSLAKEKAKGADIKIIYSTTEILDEKNKDRIFFAIGFETTTPMSAYLLKNNITIYSTHKTMIPPMKEILKNNKINGFIDPGHVSCITGSNIWEELRVPQVICGFEKDQLIRAIYKLLVLIKENKNEVINDYKEVVKEKGNIKAQTLIKKTFKISNAKWRGIGEIPNSGLEPKDDNLNAKIKYKHLLKNIHSQENSICRCSEIIRGLCEPKDCPLFAKTCTHENPIGACMVSEGEGACGIAYKYISKKG